MQRLGSVRAAAPSSQGFRRPRAQGERVGGGGSTGKGTQATGEEGEKWWEKAEEDTRTLNP